MGPESETSLLKEELQLKEGSAYTSKITLLNISSVVLKEAFLLSFLGHGDFQP